MRLDMQSLVRPAPPILPISAGAIAVAIFVVDTITDLEIAVAVFYIVVVLMSVSFCRARGVIMVSAGCMGLTLTSYLLTPMGEPRAGLVNCAISLAAIGVATYVMLRIKAVEDAIHEAQTQLAHVARVRTMGELAASIAHEVNQPLAAMMTNAQACLRWLAAYPPNDAEARQALERIVQDANRASEIVKRVRDLARKAPPRKELLGVSDIVADTLALAQAEIQQNRVSLRTDLADDLPPVVGDRSSFSKSCSISSSSNRSDERARRRAARTDGAVGNAWIE